MLTFDFSNFNSIKVRLELHFLNDNSLLIANFNSIKVRLEQRNAGESAVDFLISIP